MSNSWYHILNISPVVYWVGNDRTVQTPTTPHILISRGQKTRVKHCYVNFSS